MATVAKFIDELSKINRKKKTQMCWIPKEKYTVIIAELKKV